MSSDDRIAELVVRLGTWCEETDHEVDAAGRVDERAAAAILGKSPRTLASWRADTGLLPFYRTKPVRYALRDIAAFIEGTRADPRESARIDVAAVAGARDRGRR